MANEYPVTMPAAHGRPERSMFMNAVAQPLRGASEVVEGVMVMAYEVTDLVASRDRVHDAEERLRLAMEAASIGTFDFNPQTRTLRCDSRYRALFGIPDGTDVTPELLAKSIHPDDQARVQTAVAAALDPDTDGEFDIDYQIRGVSDGIERWAHMRGRTFFDEDRKPKRFIGTGIDITQQRRSVERLKFLADSSTTLEASLDLETTLQRVAELPVPFLSDAGLVELLDDHGAPERVAIASAGADQPTAIKPPLPHEESSLIKAFAGALDELNQGAPVFVPDVADSRLWEKYGASGPPQLLSRLGAGSLLLLPMMIRGRVIGVMALLHMRPSRLYSLEEIAFAQEVARRAAVAIDNARLYDQKVAAISIRDQFLSIASHELKTPLTSITLQLSAFGRLLASGKLMSIPQEKLKQRLGIMLKQGDRLASLIEELLDVSRISRGGLALVAAPVDLVEVVREAFHALSDEAAKRDVSLELQGAAQVEGVWDRERIEQVVLNLVENALKYGAPGKPIEVTVKSADSLAILRVHDEGSGIAPEDQKRIFEQFERAVSPNLGGLGLGLWIARKIVEAHQGRIYVESRLGAGSTFVVELPLTGPET